ncbi:hypothetical protein [Pseudosulfitobacter sp. SM2401]|jgi:hypothetical protein|uniref:hypothetical protein n=1 Tax=Pseudosulfitobacter sp. SM2401 TaxID=3350098 RepID=UPI002A356A0A|nr:hypothetical protein [Ascidiaceihabitans sp.]
MQVVTQLRLTEQVDLDHSQLSTLYAQLGPAGAEDVVCRAMEELALRLSHCERLFKAANWAELRKSARSLVAIADQIGMKGVSIVANDVTVCVDNKSDIALAATMHRLMRIGEGSLTAIWELQDITI